MNMKSQLSHLGAFLCAILAWITETTRESRSARLSTLGLPAGDHDWLHRDSWSQGDGFR